jgi:hypothetical protein
MQLPICLSLLCMTLTIHSLFDFQLLKIHTTFLRIIHHGIPLLYPSFHAIAYILYIIPPCCIIYIIAVMVLPSFIISPSWLHHFWISHRVCQQMVWIVVPSFYSLHHLHSMWIICISPWILSPKSWLLAVVKNFTIPSFQIALLSCFFVTTA